MTRIDALKALAEKVEAGEAYATMGHTRLCQKAFPSDHPTTREGYATAPAQLAINAWNQGSIDAAQQLHEAVLPDKGWEVYRTAKFPGMIPGSCPSPYKAIIGWGHKVSAHSDNPARAWLLAILRALIAEGRGDD